MRVGDRIQWMSINRAEVGVIESEREDGFLVRLDNQKCVIVQKTSIYDNRRKTGVATPDAGLRK